MATSGPLDPFLRQSSHSPPPSLPLHLDAPCILSNASGLEPCSPTHQAALVSHRSTSPVATASSVSSSSLAPSPTVSDFQSNNSTTPFMASILASRHLPLPVPQRRQSTPLMGQKSLSSQRQSSSTDLPSPISSSRQKTMSSSTPLRAWPPTRSFSHDVTPTATSAGTAAEQQQRQQLASQLQYLHQLDQMHRQRIRDIQRLHEQQQLFASPHHRLTRRHKPAASVSRPYHDVGFPSHNLSHSQLHQQQFQQQQQQQQAHGPPSLSSSHNIQALEGNKAQGLVAQPATPQPNVARAGVAAAAWSDEQHPPRQDHYVRRFQLAQRMLQIQQMLHTQRIQQLHFMHKLSKVQQPQQQLQQQHQQNPVPELMISTPTIPSSPSSPTATNASTVVVLPQDKPKVSLSQEPCSSPNIPVGTKKASSMAEIARISLPHVDTIRKQRRQRLKAQARLRQAAAERSLKTTTTTAVDVKNDGSDAHSTVKEDATSAGNTLVGSVTSGALSDRGDEAACTTKLTLPLSSAQHVRQINKSSDAALRLSDCSISHARLKTKAELAYKKQLVRQQSLQHHMIQDHTNRYRIYQAYCLMQRAREAQAMDELKVIELKQVQTRAWVESLRCQVELEVPK